MSQQRIFNSEIRAPQCQRNCKNGWVVDKFDNIIQKDGIDLRCQCHWEQLYLDANIGFSYWKVTPENYDGHPNDIARMRQYLGRVHAMRQTGQGLYLHGGNGVGKTTLAMLLLKNVIHTSKYNAMFVPFADLVILNSRIIGGYHDKDAERQINIIKNVDFLVMDDIGKEFDSGKDYTRATLNSILRYRDMWNKPTIYTANSPIEVLREHYGASNYSIMESRSTVISMEYDQDYRKFKKMENS